ncbi:hypothetical protein B0H66DRAFT_383926 [Apodospora peruviana]|uniref:Rhodopsin domain-containing protein n=1 Tax=Apodospora peruviana TaxID=516989 RepID=A0AAE0HUL3_9PEZI|nr:hypothetical protein B0H66DRAFT_383926 [Apodospora peruviana]
MAISDNPSQVGSLAMSLVVTPLVTLAIILRFIATRRAARKIGAEDWCAFLATASTIGYNIGNIWSIVVLDGRDYTQVPIETVTEILKAGYVVTQLFPLNQFFAKLSILLLYHRIFGVNRRYAFWISLLGVLQTCWTIAVLIVCFLQCKPVHHYWDVLSEGTCIGAMPLLVGFEVPNSSIDFAMVALVLVMLRELHIRPSTKWKLSFFFAAGGFCGLIGFVKIAAHFTAGQNSNNALTQWGNAQMLLSIICCCVPIYNSLVPRRADGSGFFSFVRFKSMTGYGGSSSSSSSSSSPSSIAKAKFGNHHRSARSQRQQPGTMQAGSVDTEMGGMAHEGGSWGWLQLPEGSSATDMKPIVSVSANNNSDSSSSQGERHATSVSGCGSDERCPMKTVVVHQSVEMV